MAFVNAAFQSQPLIQVNCQSLSPHHNTPRSNLGSQK